MTGSSPSPAAPNSLENLDQLGAGARLRFERAPATLERLRTEWEVEDLFPLDGATCSILYAGTQRGLPVVLKLPLADDEVRHGVPAINSFANHGGVSVMAQDASSGAVLMPRLGRSLGQLNLPDSEAVDVCARSILTLRGSPTPGGMPLEEWYSPLLEGKFGDPICQDALAVLMQLLRTCPRRRLIHGDLHHLNLLESSDGGFFAIDPKGIHADPALEVGAFMRNLQPDVLRVGNLDAKMHDRIARFAELLGDPPERLWGWSFVEVTMSVNWEDPRDDWSRGCRRIAGALRGLSWRKRLL